jgi:hypothetical protein
MAILSGAIGGQFAAIPVFNQLVPAEGPKLIFLEMDFNGVNQYSIDLEQEISQKIIWGVQSVYYDNSRNLSDIELLINVSGQRMTFKAGWQGYRPVLFANPPKGTLNTVSGTGVFSLTLLNVPMPFGDWNAL